MFASECSVLLSAVTTKRAHKLNGQTIAIKDFKCPKLKGPFFSFKMVTFGYRNCRHKTVNCIVFSKLNNANCTGLIEAQDTEAKRYNRRTSNRGGIIEVRVQAQGKYRQTYSALTH